MSVQINLSEPFSQCVRELSRTILFSEQMKWTSSESIRVDLNGDEDVFPIERDKSEHCENWFLISSSDTLPIFLWADVNGSAFKSVKYRSTDESPTFQERTIPSQFLLVIGSSSWPVESWLKILQFLSNHPSSTDRQAGRKKGREFDMWTRTQRFPWSNRV